MMEGSTAGHIPLHDRYSFAFFQYRETEEGIHEHTLAGTLNSSASIHVAAPWSGQSHTAFSFVASTNTYHRGAHTVAIVVIS
jgi:hypothetical protein